jgi:GT2 family glycosyltransferase
MPFFFRIVELVDWFVALSWMIRVWSWRRNLRRVPDLTSHDSPEGLALPSVSLIVPARNEAENISVTLRSLLALDGVASEIIAVDDRSTDNTGAIMEAVAATAVNKRLEILHVQSLPSGWLGKTHAMALAAQRARGEWLLFTDADVLFSRDAVRRALIYANASRADHMVLLPTILMESWGERMMIAFLQLLAIWALRPWRVPDPEARRDAIGVGAFNMIRREVYEALGGWEALRMEVVEDLALGRRVKAKGYAQRVAMGVDMVKVRWARGAFGVVDNLTKNLFALFHFRSDLVFAFACGLVLFTLFPLLTCLVGRAMWWPTATMLIAIFLGYQAMGKYHHFSPAQMLLFPVAAVLLLYTLLRSMLLAHLRGGVVWRGTFYSLRDLRRRGG